MKKSMSITFVYLGMFAFRLGSGAMAPIPAFDLVETQTLHQEPHTATAFGPTPATRIGLTTQSAMSVPIPAPGPTLAGALRGTRNNQLFQYSSDLSAGTKESSIVTKENVTATRYPNSTKYCHYSELFYRYQELFYHYSELYCHYQECDLTFNHYSEDRKKKYQELKEQYSAMMNHYRDESQNHFEFGNKSHNYSEFGSSNNGSFNKHRNVRLDSQGHQDKGTVIWTWIVLFVATNALIISALLGCMYAGHGHGNNQQGPGGRLPPVWAPDMEPRYTFGQWQRDVLLWTISNEDIEAHRQAAMLLQVLRGGARELTRDLPDNIILQGGMLNGIRVDGMTYIMNLLGERYGQLGEESRLRAIKDLMEFDRRPQERIDDLITRFEVTRQRAAEGGNLVMSVEGLTYKLLRACKVSDHQFMNLLLPTQGRLPQTDRELMNMFSALRRMGHVVEKSKDNIAQGLGHQHGPTANAYMTSEVTWSEPASSSWDSNQGNGWTPQPRNDGWNFDSWTEDVYMASNTNVESGTDTDTVSSLGEQEYDYSDVPQGLDRDQTAEHLFWSYQQAKGRFRRFMRKPVRKVRRFIRRKGKGKGKHPGFYLASLNDQDLEEMFFKGFRKGKGKGKRSTGKGRGRRTNPKGPDGQIMKCRKCGSTEHFQKECPQNQGAPAPRPSGPPNFYTQETNRGPLNFVNETPVPEGISHVFVITELTEQGEQSLDQHTTRPHRDWNPQNVPTASVNQDDFDPWRQSSQESRESRGQNMWHNWMPTQLREEHEIRMQTLGSPLVPPHTNSRAMSSRDDPNTQAVPRTTPQLPMWATMATSTAARSSLTWSPDPERPKPLALYRTEFTPLEPQHEQVITRFHQRKGKGESALLPYETNQERMSPDAQRMVERFQNVQQANQTHRVTRKREVRRKNKVKMAAEEAEEGVHIRYDGDVDKCVICLDRFTKGEQVTRLICRHVLHEQCLTEYLVKSKKDDPPCPECRGTTRNPKGFKYIAENHFVFSPAQSEGHRSDDERQNQGSQAQPQDPTPPRQEPFRTQVNPENPPDIGSSNSTTWSQVRPNQEPFFPCWEVKEFCYHGNTRLSDGRHGLLVDPGAWSNLVGESWAIEMAKKALNSGLKPTQVKLDHPLNVAGVGNGTNSAEWEVHLPIAIDSHGEGTRLSEFRAPSVGGLGKDLPALLGLKSMSRQGGVLEMTEGREYLTFPGSGGYQVEWSPGTRRYKLERATSGHLILPCDSFTQVDKNKGGLEEPKTTFYSGQPQTTKKFAEIGTQTDPIPATVTRNNKKDKSNRETTE